ncbi:hypothetical protein DFH27DRAFT_527292 [Peziza echinospora]|nr:hypothetical protein DFH27DRAFT_527292 [Peziza echinospora]
MRGIFFTRTFGFSLLFLGTSVSLSQSQKETYQLPKPAGPNAVGTSTVSLVDSERLDSLSPLPHHPRVFVAQFFYPIAQPKQNQYPIAPYVSELVGNVSDISLSLPNGTTASFLTNSYLNAPLDPKYDFPAKVIIFSPGMTGIISQYTTFHEELASWGFIVIALDHPYDGSVVEAKELPGGAVFAPDFFTNVTEWEVYAAAAASQKQRVDDVLYILKSLGDSSSKLVKSLPGTSQFKRRSEKAQKSWWAKNSKVGVYGHSLGGSTAAAAMIASTKQKLVVNGTTVKYKDVSPPILGGFNLEGKFLGLSAPPEEGGPSGAVIKNPFVMWGAPTHSRDNPSVDLSWGLVYDRTMKGYKRELELLNSAHATFMDYPFLAEAANLKDPAKEWPLADVIDEMLGTIEGKRVIKIVTRFLRAFFDWTLKGDKEGKKLLDEKIEVGQWPEVKYRF